MLPGRRGDAYEGFPQSCNRAESNPVCPECGNAVNEYYKNREGEVVGCEYCVKLVEVWEDGYED